MNCYPKLNDNNNQFLFKFFEYYFKENYILKDDYSFNSR